MKKTLINEFTNGRCFDIDSHGAGTLYDDNEGDILDIFLDVEKWTASLFLNKEKYNREEIVTAEICELLKKQLLIVFDFLQNELDEDENNPDNPEELQLSNDGLNYL
jgi:hypothetical protein